MVCGCDDVIIVKPAELWSSNWIRPMTAGDRNEREDRKYKYKSEDLEHTQLKFATLVMHLLVTHQLAVVERR